MTSTEHQTRIEEIVWCEGQADEMVKDADQLRWRAAQLISEELESGRTQREVAEEIGKDRAHVHRMQKVYKIAGGDLGPQERSFNDLYQSVKKPRTKKITGADLGQQERSSEPEPVEEKPFRWTVDTTSPRTDKQARGSLTSCDRKYSFETDPTMNCLTRFEDSWNGVRSLLQKQTEEGPRDGYADMPDFYLQKAEGLLDMMNRQITKIRSKYDGK